MLCRMQLDEKPINETHLACRIWEQGSASRESGSSPNDSLHPPHRSSRSSSMLAAARSKCVFCSSSPSDPYILDNLPLTVRINN